MLSYTESEFYRGYTLCRLVCGERRTYVAMQNSCCWWEGDTKDEVKKLIDAALADG